MPRTAPTQPAAPQVIGTITSYTGAEHAYLRGYKVRILGILRRDAGSEDDGVYITDDHELARVGGVRLTARVEVAPNMEGGGPRS